jgi:hypothetical protein
MDVIRKPSSIAAIVVTRNRLTLLRECIAAIRQQSRRPDEIVVVDNASDDGTADWLAQQSDVTVCRQENLGSAGGQYTGIKTAYSHGHDWFWCMDDDTVPRMDLLGQLCACRHFKDPQTGCLCSLVVWTDGKTHQLNAPALAPCREWLETVLNERCLRVESCSFVSAMFSRPAVAAAGLPLKEFFLWGDDVEFTRRIARHFRAYLVLDSIAVHKTLQNTGVARNQFSNQDLLKFCYGARNEIAMVLMERPAFLTRMVRLARVFRFYLTITPGVRSRIRLIVWMFRGFFFRPQPEKV